MRNNFLIFLLLLFFNQLFSQTGIEVDELVKKYPKKFSTSKILADRILNDFKTDYSKARAIFTWIALNITYDIDASLNPIQTTSFSYSSEEDKQAKLADKNKKKCLKTFQSQKGLCSDYALLFQEIATKVGLKSQVIKGASKTLIADIDRKKAPTDHDWNAVEIDGIWRLIDVTWSAGSLNLATQKFNKEFNPVYFDMPQELFFKQHFPQTETWLNQKLDDKDFLNGPLFFKTYYTNTIDLISPKLGLLRVKANQKIVFTIQNLKLTDKIYYKSLNQKSIEVQSQNKTDFIISCDELIENELIIFLNQNAIIAYKIIKS